jgi:hypothetical protein
MEPPEPDQFQVGLFDLGCDPPMRPGGVGASIDHTLRVEIEAHMEAPEGTAKRPADLKVARRYDSPLDRRPPREFTIRQVHGEHAPSIGREDGPRSEIGSQGYNVIGTGGPWVR